MASLLEQQPPDLLGGSQDAVGLLGAVNVPPTLKEKLERAARVASPEESAEYFSDPNDFRWAETDTEGDEPTIYINDRKFSESGAEGYRDKIASLERLHLLKDVDPERYDQIYAAAMSSPEYKQWAEESYQHALDSPDYGEERGFDDWHRQSRFDQVMGGYLMSGDKNIPTAKNWTRNEPYGDALRKELERLEIDMGMGP
jgi:hypothetical protein